MDNMAMFRGKSSKTGGWNMEPNLKFSSNMIVNSGKLWCLMNTEKPSHLVVSYFPTNPSQGIMPTILLAFQMDKSWEYDEKMMGRNQQYMHGCTSNMGYTMIYPSFLLFSWETMRTNPCGIGGMASQTTWFTQLIRINGKILVISGTCLLGSAIPVINRYTNHTSRGYRMLNRGCALGILSARIFDDHRWSSCAGEFHW